MFVMGEVKCVKKLFIGERIYQLFVTEEIYEIKFIGKKVC
jgi:hypothetical protein